MTERVKSSQFVSATSGDAGFDLFGLIALVTGGGRGIGRGIAEALARYGAYVIICGRTESTLESCMGGILSNGGSGEYIIADVAKAQDVQTLRDQIKARHSRLDVLVNNAGINPYYEVPEKTSLQHWQEIIDVNLTGVFLCCRLLGEIMLAQKSGSIINISSIAGRVGLPKTLAYCAAKGGVEMMSRSLALDWAAHNIRVNTVAPGYVDTDLTQGLAVHPILFERLRSNTPLGRFANVNEIVGAVVYLASSASSYVTGQTIGVDGGWTAA